ncbi:MAG: hypothetical protein KKD39_04915 [Candidatus Altiarchaeota archaeon]|nr:hypothetical protein [Candidatus Altiarchaeota archaeon]
MLSRFLVISKYEIKQYLRSTVDEAILALVLLTGFLMLITPEVGETNLPSSYKLYTIGYVQDMIFKELDPYSIDFISYPSHPDLVQAASFQEVDVYSFKGVSKIVFFGTGTPRSGNALTTVDALMPEINSLVISRQLDKDSTLSGVLLPIRLQMNYEEINYTNSISPETIEKRKRLLGETRLLEGQSEEAANASATSNLPVSSLGEDASSTMDDLLDEGNATFGDITLPSDLNVEFPFKNLYKNMTLLSPIIFLSILLSLSLSRERVDKNIENLFTAPLTRTEIIIGKAFPYAALMVFLSLAYGLYINPSTEGFKASAVFLVLSATMLSFSVFSAVISRSYRELTFIGSFSIFAFFFFIILPNVFSGVNILAFISPLDIVTSIENNAVIPATDLILSMLPYMSLFAFFASFSWVCFTPEVLYESKSFWTLLSIFYDSLSKMLKRDILFVFASVSLLVPFVFVLESIVAYLLLPLGSLAPAASLLLLATVEEIVKILPFYFKKTNPIKYSIYSGVAFFLTEKIFNLYLIYKVYSFLGGPYTYFLSRLAPTLAVHIMSTFLFATVLYYNRGNRKSLIFLGLMLSVMTHYIYNMLVLGGMV